MPDWVAGHPALELCNTMALWDRPDAREYLTTFDDAVVWGREHRVLTAAEARNLRALPARTATSSLRELRRLRAMLYHACVAEAPLDGVHGFVTRAFVRSHYRATRGRTELYVPPGRTVLLDRLALQAHDLLDTYGTASVGLCASEACGWVFLDPTHRRRWCTMAVCGNRAKARRFAARRREPSERK